ncbi:PP2C family protein-serine/threonine phosphatase [soil metagenome]
MTPPPTAAAGDPGEPGASSVERLLVGLGRCRPGDLGDLVAEVAAHAWGASDVVLHLITHEQTELVPVPAEHLHARGQQSLDSGPAGRCFVTEAQVREGAALWTPVRHGADRLGVLELVLPDDAPAATVDDVARVAQALGLALSAHSRYGDHVEGVRRSQEMSLGAELLWSVLLPPTYASPGVSLSVLLEPTYSTGGDAYDYAVTGDTVHVLVLDAMGHGFPAASLSTIAIAAYRHSRRLGLDLAATAQAMDTLVAGSFETTFATAVLVELDITTGRLTWVSAGHPEPLVVRGVGTDASRVETLTSDPAPPLGVGAGLARPAVQEDFLEPGDVLVLYTEGVTEARHLDGSMVGEDGFAELVRRESDEEHSVAELTRRVRARLLAAEDAWLSDDVTALLLRWQPEV